MRIPGDSAQPSTSRPENSRPTLAQRLEATHPFAAHAAPNAENSLAGYAPEGAAKRRRIETDEQSAALALMRLGQGTTPFANEPGNAPLPGHYRPALERQSGPRHFRHSMRTLAYAISQLAYMELNQTGQRSPAPAAPQITPPAAPRPVEPPVYIAARSDDLDAVRTLIAQGCDVNLAEPAVRATALHVAARRGHTQIVEALLAAGADPTLKTLFGHTPMNMARMGRKPAVVQILRAALAAQQPG